MSFSIQNPLYPRPAFDQNGLIVASASTTVSGTAALATAFSTTPNPSVGGFDLVTFDVQNGAVRVRWDSVSPTATVGHLLPANTAYTWNSQMFTLAKFILDTTASSATIFASAIQV